MPGDTIMPERISADSVQQAISSGEDVLLVCAYEDEEKCRNAYLEESITLKQLQSELDDMQRDRQLVFFCA